MSPTVVYPDSEPSYPSAFVPRGTGYMNGNDYTAYADERPERTLSQERDEIDFHEVPAVIWRDEYNDNHRGLQRQVQHISDYMLARDPSIYRHGNPNVAKCRRVYNGIIDPDDYDTASNTFGSPGVAEIKDYKFLYTVGQRIIGQKLQMPFQFDVKDGSPTAREKRLNAAIDQFTEKAARSMASALQQKSQDDGAPADFSFLKNPAVNPDAPVDELSQNEKTLNFLLRDSVTQYRTLDQMRLCTEDKTQLNAQAARVIVEGDQVYAQREDIENIDWISVGRIRSAEDCSAIGIREYVPTTTIFERFGDKFGSRGIAENLTEMVRKLRSGRGSLAYRPQVFQLTDGRNNTDIADYLTTSISGEGYNVWETTNWQHTFYPWDSKDATILHSTDPVKVLIHTIYFRVIKYRKVRVTINGKKPTTKQWEEYLYRNYESKLDVTFTELKDGEQSEPGDQKIPYTQLWQATRVGHKLIFDIKRCTHAPRDIRQPKRVKFPIILSVNYKHGIGALSLEFVRLWNTLWNRIDEKLLLAGASSFIMLDEAQMSVQEGNDLRASALKTGFGWYNSTKLQDRSNPMARYHLERRQLGDEAQQVQNLIALAGLLKATFDSMVGVGDAAQGRAGSYDTTSKLSFLYGQQTAVTQEFWHEDTQFNNDVLQRVSEIQRMVRAKDDWAEVQYEGTGGQRLIKSVMLSKSLADTWPMVRLENAQKLQKIQDDIEVLAQQALSSGATGLREIIKLKFADNVQDALAIFDSGLSALEELQARQSQQQQQLQAQKIQADAQKSQLPLQVEQMRGQNALAVVQAKQQGERQKEDFKGQMADNQEVWARERSVQQSELDKDREQFGQNLLTPEWTTSDESTQQ